MIIKYSEAEIENVYEAEKVEEKEVNSEKDVEKQEEADIIINKEDK